MIIECTHPDHAVDPATGRTACPDPDCLVAAADGGFDPMDRLPAARPEWILASPDRLDAREVEALAVLGDAGLVPQVVGLEAGPAGAEPIGFTPARRLRRAG
ncbi:hypothetical protein BRM1_02420 [Brevibacterium sp. BRM-1]|uniref:hypothetical protein n=1 Tax=Brevibacterium sp. BRM-1 TaxID=2999062 RepID=UPI002280D775|nr:hypothetical protein [Brevibacterium sp. BRM-1]WAL40747.1 hypothetical protein BRM1_02420 [Brevibacterium sp. BRM-1]